MAIAVVRRGQRADAVYIGRGSAFGNPFVIGKDGNRLEVIRKFQAYWVTKCDNSPAFKRAAFEHLRKAPALACFCAPQACHGDVLVAWVERMEAQKGA